MAARAQLDLAELDLAQLGDGLLALGGLELQLLDVDLDDAGAVLGDRGLGGALGALELGQLAAQRQHPGELGQALRHQRFLGRELLGDQVDLLLDAR